MSPKSLIEPIANLISAVQLEGVRLVESSSWTRIRSATETPKARLSFRPDARLAGRGNDGVFYVLARGEATVTPADKEGAVVSVEATFELQYRLPAGFKASDEDLNQFARVNGVFNAWPYWREFVQAASSRMNLPPIVLPLFRLRKTVLTPGKRRVRLKTGDQPRTS